MFFYWQKWRILPRIEETSYLSRREWPHEKADDVFLCDHVSADGAICQKPSCLNFAFSARAKVEFFLSAWNFWCG